MKLKKSTIMILVMSWILFLGVCFAAFYQLGQMREARSASEKILRDQTTK